MGGRRSVRGYRQNVRIGDNGLRFSLENQIALWRDASGRPTLQLAPFVDLGTVWNSQARRDQPDQRFLLAAGVGLLWQPFPAFNLRLDYGLALVDLSDRGNNLQDDGLYFTLNYRF
jgi:hemolysin activation/secretion protein